MDVVEATAMERAGGDRGGASIGDQRGQEVVRLLAVGQSGEGAVLPLEEHPGEDQDVGQEPRLAFGEANFHEGKNASRLDALAGFGPDGS